MFMLFMKKVVPKIHEMLHNFPRISTEYLVSQMIVVYLRIPVSERWQFIVLDVNYFFNDLIRLADMFIQRYLCSKTHYRYRKFIQNICF